MSPCTAKLSAFRHKQVGKYVEPPTSLAHPQIRSTFGPKKQTNKERRLTCQPTRVKPKSLFAQASAKKLESGSGSSTGDALFGSKPASPPNGGL